ncbi:MAG: SAM-dependent methyltransferase [Dehalococcoidales bacterium]|nr:SAM-dependent methyltransferase [Dehalococcoidales bacterium]
MNNRNTGRTETKSSRTAGFTCLSRAASYVDKRECYSGPDSIAYRLIPLFFKLLLKSKWLFMVFRWRFFPNGIYEYVIARTRYFDAVFVEALENSFDQIVIFGAGFDSRTLRFNSLNKGTRVFELDAPATQRDKVKVYLAKKLVCPENLVFVPLDFNRESLPEKIAQAGFAPGRKTLFLLEGITMYLSKEAVENTFRFISEAASSGSLVVFDYIHAAVLRREHGYYGERKIYDTVARVGEEWTFAFDESEIDRFLEKYGFRERDHSRTPELEDKYFRNSQGSIVCRINGTHAIVTGIKV